MQNSDMRKILGKCIRQERKKRGYTIEELSELAGITPSFLGHVERANRFLSLENYYNISKALGIKVPLLEDSDNNESEKYEILHSLLNTLNSNELNLVIELAKAVKNASKLNEIQDNKTDKL